MSRVPFGLGGWWVSIYYTFHATLLLAACLMYHFEFSSSNEQVVPPVWSYNDIEHAAGSLLKGQKAIEKLGQDTRSSKRISKTVSKLVETISKLASGRIHLTQVSDANNVEGEDMQIPANESYDFGIDSSNFWQQDQFDILSGLGGFDTSLIGFTAA
ncbi:hypothetical protein LTR05_007361 [Lithohypha guttulata]|uniref:Uncharacterized protein n=1 Tax=Lithohypha guttulata TaxID=1690604 RepID=A0AAN7SUX7_9EURO|nr:hypothetical protein LTR05_007361 [Lithohypha guttulata]